MLTKTGTFNRQIVICGAKVVCRCLVWEDAAWLYSIRDIRRTQNTSYFCFVCFFNCIFGALGLSLIWNVFKAVQNLKCHSYLSHTLPSTWPYGFFFSKHLTSALETHSKHEIRLWTRLGKEITFTFLSWTWQNLLNIYTSILFGVTHDWCRWSHSVQVSPWFTPDADLIWYGCAASVVHPDRLSIHTGRVLNTAWCRTAARPARSRGN